MSEPGWIPNDQTFGMRLAMIRKAQHWNAKQGGRRVRHPQNSWRDWEVRGSTHETW